MTSKRRSSPMIRLGIRARPPSVRSISLSQLSQLVNQSLLHQSSFHKDPIPTKDITHWRTSWPNRRSLKVQFLHRDIQIFLNFTNFYYYFIKNYFRIAAPLTSIFKDSVNGRKTDPFEFTEKEKTAFELLKVFFIRAFMLTGVIRTHHHTYKNTPPRNRDTPPFL
jgi:hypothetical protein